MSTRSELIAQDNAKKKQEEEQKKRRLMDEFLTEAAIKQEQEDAAKVIQQEEEEMRIALELEEMNRNAPPRNCSELYSPDENCYDSDFEEERDMEMYAKQRAIDNIVEDIIARNDYPDNYEIEKDNLTEAAIKVYEQM